MFIGHVDGNNAAAAIADAISTLSELSASLGDLLGTDETGDQQG